ncbi:hypothetical protein I7I53_09402 [Histoplasma capsulatum var. duboisii H88]|uniref:Uncharacterized protein n=1 Tax=Ajellomyces capsulatus (strain H88) TaxID=544711 RepID=A0A8A1L6P3_AJEC8|nr:hypothetical protein I7I53_09402 [Histoplasma capsulatum var. duboisii H88]
MRIKTKHMTKGNHWRNNRPVRNGSNKATHTQRTRERERERYRHLVRTVVSASLGPWVPVSRCPSQDRNECSPPCQLSLFTSSTLSSLPPVGPSSA